jgi:hypothetical protein
MNHDFAPYVVIESHSPANSMRNVTTQDNMILNTRFAQGNEDNEAQRALTKSMAVLVSFVTFLFTILSVSIRVHPWFTEPVHS